MGYFLVSYDLHNRRDYQPLWDYLLKLGAVRVLESLWVVELTRGGAGGLTSDIRAVIDGDDSLVVIELKPGSEWATVRAKKAGQDWLQRNVRQY